MSQYQLTATEINLVAYVYPNQKNFLSIGRNYRGMFDRKLLKRRIYIMVASLDDAAGAYILM